MRKYLGYCLFAGALAAAACGTSAKTGGGSHATGGGAANGGNGSYPGGGEPPILVPNGNAGASADNDPGNPNITHPKCTAGACTDFPTAPIMGDGVPANVATLFGAAANFTPGSLCALEPQLSGGGKEGAMMPANWVRPRFRVMAPTGIDTLEIRLHSAAEMNDLVAYTTYKPGANGEAPSWYLPKEIWTGVTDTTTQASGVGFANNAAGQPVTVTIRGVNSKAPGMPVGVTGDFNIAPVVSTGSMVFWTVSSGLVTKDSSKLLGFAVADEGVAETLSLDSAKADSVKWTGEIGEDGATLRGFYDTVKLADFVPGQVRCIGCHTTIPDGSGVLFGDDWPWSVAGAALTTGAVPTALSAGAQAIMKTPWWGQQTMSKAHWTTGDHTIITSYGTTFISGAQRTIPWAKLPSYAGTDGATTDDKIKWHALAWINADYNPAVPIPVTIAVGNDYGSPNLAARNTAVAQAKSAGGWGLIATGDTNISDVSPAMSHDGMNIAYVTTDKSPDGHPDATATTADVRIVPYNSKAGGVSAPLAGASDPSLLEYYPSYSQDDKLIAFTQAPKSTGSGNDGPYYNPNGKIMVIPAGGGVAVPLAANDANTCGGEAAGAPIINSWPKWSPDVVPVKGNGKTYYFLVFSSARKYADEFSAQFMLPPNPASSFKGASNSSQLYLAAIVVDNASNTVTTYPAVYIWNQNRTPAAGGTAAGLKYSNLTPAWDPITLPPLDIPEVPSDEIPK
jgi:hypothetical protein